MSIELLNQGVDPDDETEDDYCPDCGRNWDEHSFGEPIFDKDGQIIGADYFCPEVIDDDLFYIIAVDHICTED